MRGLCRLDVASPLSIQFPWNYYLISGSTLIAISSRTDFGDQVKNANGPEGQVPRHELLLKELKSCH
jgi:hypothetical protein